MGKPWKHFKPDEFVYGTCYSDHKRKGKMRLDNFDYFFLNSEDMLADEENWGNEQVYKSLFVCSVFEKLGLPLPHENEIHYGSDGVLLFLNSHGVVIRIHETEDGDPRLFLNPHILQPLGWVSSEDARTVVAIYPAISLFEGGGHLPAIEAVEDGLMRSFFDTRDLDTINNIGYLSLSSENCFPVALDISFRIAEHPGKHNRQKTFDAFNKARRRKRAFDSLKVQFMHHQHSPFPKSVCKDAFDYHQPLRHAFFMAWPDADKEKGQPSPLRMKKFWQMAYNYAHKGYKICKKDSQTARKSVKEARKNPLSWRKKNF